MRMDYSIAIVWLILAFAIFGKWNSVRCEVFSSSELSSIDETIAELMSCRRIPGLGMSIAKQDQFLAKGYGVADVNEGTPMTENTVMCIGSATKAFTSALLAVLITEDNKNGGTLSWTTTLCEIFGEDFRLTSDPIISSQTTLEDILSHRSGVESTDAMLMAQLYSDQHRKSLLSRLHLLPTNGEFRGHFIYNNLMYGLAGLAAEAIGKKPYFELMKEKLLQPLNITSAVLADNMDYSQNLTSKPHQMVNGSVVLSDSRFFRLGSFSPAGALCLSPADLTKWLYFLNHYGTTLSQHRLINSLLFAKMISPKVSLDFMTQLSLGLFSKFPEPSYISWYALGWFGRFYRGDIDFLHGGSMFSYYSVVVMDPTSQTGIALTVNGLNPTILPYDLYPLAYFLKDILLGQTPWLNKTTICSYPAPWLPSSPRTPPKQAVQEKYVGSTCEFVGKFGHPLYGEVQITEKDQSLYFQWGNIMNGTLYDHKKSRFRLRLDDNVYLVLGSEFGSANIAFSNNSSGQYNNLKMTLSSLSETYDFRRGVSFDVSLPLSSPSSSTVSMRPQNTVSLSLYIIVFYFIKVLH